jgi:hypothetical protein
MYACMRMGQRYDIIWGKLTFVVDSGVVEVMFIMIDLQYRHSRKPCAILTRPFQTVVKESG